MSHYNQPLFRRKFTEFFLWPVQGILVFIIVGFIRLLPVSLTSFLCGKLANAIGPYTTHHQRAKTHLTLALPDITTAEQEQILHKMWNHLGRLAGEYPHVHHMGSERYMTFHGLEHLKNASDGGFLVGAHLGNWELNLMVTALLGRPYSIIYRKLNNPFTNWVLDTRHKRGNPDSFAKGKDAARGMLKSLDKKHLIHIIADQKYREGIKAPFLGLAADTPTGHIKIALKRKTPIIYMRAIRRQGCHYDIYIDPPVYIHTKEKITDELVAYHAVQMNDKLSQFIKESPEQWLWPHRRWGKDILK